MLSSGVLQRQRPDDLDESAVLAALKSARLPFRLLARRVGGSFTCWQRLGPSSWPIDGVFPIRSRRALSPVENFSLFTLDANGDLAPVSPVIAFAKIAETSCADCAMMTYDRGDAFIPAWRLADSQIRQNLISALRPRWDMASLVAAIDRANAVSTWEAAARCLGVVWGAWNQCARKSWISRLNDPSSEPLSSGIPFIGVVANFLRWRQRWVCTIVYDGKTRHMKCGSFNRGYCFLARVLGGRIFVEPEAAFLQHAHLKRHSAPSRPRLR